jgi:group I intron endonuclease
MSTCGIYKIESKIHPDRCYIGSSNDVLKRKNDHFGDLKRNKHGNPKLQAHYNKYGMDDLVFSIVIGCNEEDLIIQEQFFIDSLNPFFNICKTAGCLRGIPRTKEAIEKHRAKMIGRVPWNKGKKMGALSAQLKKRLSELRKGEKHPMFGKHHTLRSRKKMRKSHLGKKLPQETINKMKGRIPWNKGKKSVVIPWNKGKKGVYSEEALRKMGLRKKIVPPWNKGLSKETNEVIRLMAIKETETKKKIKEQLCQVA